MAYYLRKEKLETPEWVDKAVGKPVHVYVMPTGSLRLSWTKYGRKRSWNVPRANVEQPDAMAKLRMIRGLRDKNGEFNIPIENEPVYKSYLKKIERIEKKKIKKPAIRKGVPTYADVAWV